MKRLSLGAFSLLVLLLLTLSGCCFLAKSLLSPDHEKSIGYCAETIVRIYRPDSKEQDVQEQVNCVRKGFRAYQKAHKNEYIDRLARDVALNFAAGDHENYIRKPLSVDDWLKYWNKGDVLPFPQEIVHRASPYQYKDYLAEYRSHAWEGGELPIQDWAELQYGQCGASVYTREERCAALAAVNRAPAWCLPKTASSLTP